MSKGAWVRIFLGAFALIAVAAGPLVLAANYWFKPKPLYIGTRALLERLQPEGAVQPAPIRPRAPIHGSAREEDVLVLRRLIARVPDINHEIIGITFWESMAARVQLDRYFVYCARDKNGVWQISQLVPYVY
jgi:hypothetical protein